MATCNINGLFVATGCDRERYRGKMRMLRTLVDANDVVTLQETRGRAVDLVDLMQVFPEWLGVVTCHRRWACAAVDLAPGVVGALLRSRMRATAVLDGVTPGFAFCLESAMCCASCPQLTLMTSNHLLACDGGPWAPVLFWIMYRLWLVTRLTAGGRLAGEGCRMSFLSRRLGLALGCDPCVCLPTAWLRRVCLETSPYAAITLVFVQCHFDPVSQLTLQTSALVQCIVCAVRNATRQVAHRGPRWSVVVAANDGTRDSGDATEYFRRRPVQNWRASALFRFASPIGRTGVLGERKLRCLCGSASRDLGHEAAYHGVRMPFQVSCLVSARRFQKVYRGPSTLSRGP